MSATRVLPPRIAAVIVNYKSAALVMRHFPALKAELAAFPGARAYIVDNASPGDDAARLAAFSADEPLIAFIASSENGGFAKGNNLALRRALGETPPLDYILLLNPDAYLRSGALAALVGFLDANPKAGLAGARLEAESGAPHVSAFRYFSALGEFEGGARTGVISAVLARWRIAPPQRDAIIEADWLCGAAILIRREVFETAGLFDENYFLYYEETDLMLAARRAGWRAWYVPAARAVHHEGGSTGLSKGDDEARETPAYWYQSRTYYYRKNHGAAYAALADASWLAGAAIYYLRLLATGRDRRSFGRSVARFAKSQFGGGLAGPDTKGRGT